MIQIPVIPLERTLWDFTGGHYQDEFSENHTKDLVVREWISGHVPCAGVGCAFSRNAILAINKDKGEKNPFDVGNLTEDYALALRIKELGLKQAFVRYTVSGSSGHKDIIATREYFPNTLAEAVKQKSRWIIGIVIQGWIFQKWRGPLSLKYILFRDRKGVFMAPLSILAYFLMINWVLLWVLNIKVSPILTLPPLIREDEPLLYLLMFNFFFVMNRVIHRASFCYFHYGFKSALFSIPRQVWANVINFLATLRAAKIYFKHLFLNATLTWDKTNHSFPEIDELSAFQKKLGQILIEKGYLDQHKLRYALKLQKNNKKPLGKILLENEIIRTTDLHHALQQQKEN